MDIKMLTPTTIQELIDSLKSATPKSKIIAGGTDLVIAIRAGKISPDLLIDVSNIKEMTGIKKSENNIIIGASSCFTDLANNILIRQYFPAIAKAASGVGSQQVRNRGTIGGNLVNASPAGDMLPALLALDAKAGTVNSSGHTDYKTVLEIINTHEFTRAFNVAVTLISLPVPEKNRHNCFAKLGSRRAVSIARLNAALNVICSKDGILSDVVIVLGALGKVPTFAKIAASALEGRKFSMELLEPLTGALAQEVELAIPGRYSLQYKKFAMKGIAADLLSELQKTL